VAPKVVQGIFTISRDVTEIKELEIKQKKQIEALNLLSERILVKTNKLQNFAYIVTHNLKSNLANMEMLMEMYGSADSPEEKQKIFEQSKNVQKNLSQTLKELSEVVKINQNIEVEMEFIDIQSTVDHVCGGISMLLAQTEAEIETDFSDQPVLEYNKVYLESIIQNLVTNAIKYRHPDRNPHLKFTSKETEVGITLSCTDNGRGIDLKKYGEKIFGLHRTFHGNQDARGVGLFITRNQVEALGGSISVESEVGTGTTFTIWFGNRKRM